MKADAVRLVCMEGTEHERHVLYAAELNLPMACPGMYSSHDVIICGSGPSLVDPCVVEDLLDARTSGAVIVGLKEAIRILGEHDIAVDASVSMDGGLEQIAKTPYDDRVRYFVATSCHPQMFAHLEGCEIYLYHARCGFPNEGGIYRRLFEQGAMMAGGLTVANRAIALFRWMGAASITLAGCDFGWRDDKFDGYAAGAVNGSKGAHCRIRDGGRTDGREWFTKPDLLLSAIPVAKEARAGRLQIWGDSLAQSLARHDDGYLDGLVVFGEGAVNGDA